MKKIARLGERRKIIFSTSGGYEILEEVSTSVKDSSFSREGGDIDVITYEKMYFGLDRDV